MNKKIILTSIIALCMACPTYADIAKNNNDPSCDQSTIGATTGTTDLEAEWDPNTINMEWYSDGSKITPVNNAANTCTYDGNVTLPTNTLSKTGYTFLGWRVVQACFANLGTSYGGSANHLGYKDANGTAATNANKYSLTSNNTWAIEFGNGVVKGRASCQPTLDAGMTYMFTNIDAVMNGTKDADEALAEYAAIAGPEKANIMQQAFIARMNGDNTTYLTLMLGKLLAVNGDASYTTTSTGKYCFCQATDFIPNTGSACNNSNTPWFYVTTSEDPMDGSGSESGCASLCADQCSGRLSSYPDTYLQ